MIENKHFSSKCIKSDSSLEILHSVLKCKIYITLLQQLNQIQFSNRINLISLRKKKKKKRREKVKVLLVFFKGLFQHLTSILFIYLFLFAI